MTLTLAGLLADDILRHHEFPATAKSLFFGHCASNAMPLRVSEAVFGLLENSSSQWQGHGAAFGHLDSARRNIARMIASEPEEIALIAPTSLALGVVAESLRWSPGDHLLLPQHDFPANVQPWWNLRRLGVIVEEIPVPPDGRLTWERIEPLLTPRTRLVTLSAVHYLTGHRPRLKEIGSRLRERGILFCLDVIQALGPVPIQAEWADIMAGGGNKWLLSLLGSGFLYVRRDVLEQMGSVPMGWRSIQRKEDYVNPGHDLDPTAGRFEFGTPNLVGAAALSAASGLYLELGLPKVHRQVELLHDLVVRLASERGFKLFGAHIPGETSGIVSLEIPGFDAEAFAERGKDVDLGGRNLIITSRKGYDGRPLLRVAVHFYNTETEVKQLFELIDRER